MQHIKGIARLQIIFDSLEDRIAFDNPVRFIDIFAAKLDIKNKTADDLVCCLQSPTLISITP